MDLSTLVSPAEAAERLHDYTTQLAAERTAEDEAIAAAYRAAARGLPVIALSHVIAAGGWFPNGLPKLAVCRATATDCWVNVNTWRRAGQARITYTATRNDRGRAAVGKHRVELDLTLPPAWTRATTGGHTVVPLIPPPHRPRRCRLAGFHVLWEVEQWDPTPPRDPALLRHIRGDLWSVVATWDLTELERAVLSARLTR